MNKQIVSLKRGQAAMEYLFVVGFAFALLIPIILLFYTQSNAFEEEVRFTQAKNALEEITQAANNVYYLGPPSKQTLRIQFPNNVREVIIDDQLITLVLDTSTSNSLISAQTVANLSGSIPAYSGLHVISVLATTDGVLLSE